MKKYNQNTPLKTIVTAIAALGIIAVPAVMAEKERTTTTTTKVERVPLKTEVTSTFIDGYEVPNEYRTYFSEVPAPTEKNLVVRYYNGRAYYVNSSDWKIVRVVDLDTSIKLAEEDAAMVAGYVIPADRRTRFIDVPYSDEKLTVRYYNNTAYYMDPSFRIVRTVRLKR